MVFLQMDDRRGEDGSSHMLTIFTSTSSDDDATPQFSFNHNHIKGLQQLSWNWPFQQLSTSTCLVDRTINSLHLVGPNRLQVFQDFEDSKSL